MTICHQKALYCINRFFFADCVCRYGYSGDGRQYCDGKWFNLNFLDLIIIKNCKECGIQRKKPNARIVGGVEAIPDSWPSAALIISSYKTEFLFNSKLIIKNRIVYYYKKERW